tara:strand:+ start:680 stop:799 length:120 start_codon:yes stop_codon:yes gene_type:complete
MLEQIHPLKQKDLHDVFPMLFSKDAQRQSYVEQIDGEQG